MLSTVKLEARGLLFPVPGTRGWHLNLPTGLPPDRATDAEALAFLAKDDVVIAIPCEWHLNRRFANILIVQHDRGARGLREMGAV